METDRINNTDPSHDRLELRSKKVRDLLEDIPSPAVRYGTLVIAAVFLIAVVAMACMRCSGNESTSLLEYVLSGIMP